VNHNNGMNNRNDANRMNRMNEMNNCMKEVNVQMISEDAIVAYESGIV